MPDRPFEIEADFERTDFQTRVAEIFAALPCPEIERLDASPDPDAVEAVVRAAVARRLDVAL